jgi:hypothetical protein
MAKQEAIGRAVTSMIDALKSDGPDILKEKTPSNEERLQAPGGTPPPDPKPGSPHHQGRALDIVLYNSNTERLIADDLIVRFLANRTQIGWEYMAYNRQCWNSAGTLAPLIWTKEKGESSGMKDAYVYEHHTHIHIQWSANNKNTDYSSAIKAALSGERDVVANLKALRGWWDVNDGLQYYYYFGPGGFVQWSYKPPLKIIAPIKEPKNQGSYSVTSGGLLTIKWNPAGGGSTIETFTGVSSTVSEMTGTSNRFNDLTARKMA